MQNDTRSTVQMLLIERIGYQRRGLTDRVKQIDDLLARLGEDVSIETATAEPQIETAARKKPLRRKKG
jgi:hypothetical protein